MNLPRLGVQRRDRRRFSPVEEAQIIGRYDEGEPTRNIAKAFDCSEETIRRILVRNSRQTRPKRRLNPAIQSKIIEAYYQDISQIATEISGDRHGVPEDPDLCGGRIDVHAFRNPGADGFYWIGFLMADGNVTEDGTLSVILQSSDRAHIEKLRVFLKSDAPILDKMTNARSFKPGGTAVLLSVRSQDIVDDLKRWVSVCRDGTENLVPDEMARHVWRGIMDWNGTVRVNKRGQLELRLYGSKVLCERFQAYVRVLAPGCQANVFKSGGTNCVYLCSSAAETVALALYRDCSTCLDRKFAVVARFFGWI